MAKPLRCRLGLHAWRSHRNDQGQGYLVCARCGREDDPGSRTAGPIGAG